MYSDSKPSPLLKINSNYATVITNVPIEIH